MSQLNAAQTVAAQVFPSSVVFDNTFELALLNPKARFNIVVEMQAFLKQALQPTFGIMADMTFADQVLNPDPNAVPSVKPQSVLLRFSSRPLNWRWDDEISPNGYAEARLATRSSVESSVNITPTTEAGGVLNVGSIIVNDQDRYLGPWLRDYAFTGRSVRVLWGVADRPRKDYRELLTAFVSKIERPVNGKAVVRVEDQRFRLNVPFQSRLFDGAGTIPGTPEQFGTRRPRLIGYRRHVEPLVVDNATGLRMINDGPINAVLTGMFGGEPAIDAGDYSSLVNLYAAAIPEGGYATCNALGLVLPRPALGYTGPFTVEVQGDASLNYTEGVGQLILNEMRRANIGSHEINVGAFSFMDQMSGGYWYDGSSELTIKEVIEQLAQSAGGRIASDLLFTAIKLQPPDLQQHEDEFISAEVEDLQDLGLIGLPVTTFRLFYAKNDRVLSPNEIVLPGQNALLKESLQKEFMVAELSNPLTPFRFAARTALVEKESLLNDANSATIVLTQLRDFFSVERRLWSCKLPARAMRRNVGAILKLHSDDEVQFAGGVNAILVANNRQLEGMHSIVHVIV